MKAKIIIGFEKEVRKDVIAAIAALQGAKPHYEGVSTMAYTADGWRMDSEGKLTSPVFEMDAATSIEPALMAVAETGHETDERLTVELIPEELDVNSIDKMGALLEGKVTLIRAALATALNLNAASAGDYGVELDFFNGTVDFETILAYLHFSASLYDMVGKQKRVTVKDKLVDNEKYAFRCFLIRLGLNGKEYKTTRKVLLQHLAGNGSFKSGARKPQDDAPQEATESDLADEAQDLPDVGPEAEAEETVEEPPAAADEGDVAATEGEETDEADEEDNDAE